LPRNFGGFYAGITGHSGKRGITIVLEDLKIQATYSKTIKMPNLNINIIEQEYKKDNTHHIIYPLN